MKKIILLLIPLFLNTFIVNCQIGWSTQNSNTQLNLHDLKFIDNNTGWCVGQNGLIIKTTNGGLNWDNQVSNSTRHLLGIDFINANTGIVVGGDNYGMAVILKTTNSGVNWVVKLYSSVTQLIDLTIVNTSIVYAVGTPSVTNVMVKSSNLGENWSVVNTGITNSPLYSLFFKNENTGWICGGIYNSQNADALYETTNGGVSWLNQSQNTTPYHRSIYFKDDLTGWVIGPRAFETTNGGINWVRVNDSLSGGKIYFANSNTGWILSNYILKTTDGGNFWKKYQFGTYNIRNFNFINENTGWMCGDSGVILKTTTGGSTPPTAPVLLQPLNNSTNQILNTNLDWQDIQIADRYRLQISTDNGFGQTIYDNSNIFQSQYSIRCLLTYNSIYYWRVKGINSLGESDWSQIWNFRTSLIPNTWYKVYCGNSSKLNSIKFTDSLAGFCIGENSLIYKTTNSGFNWNNIYAFSGENFIDLSIIDNQNILVASHSGKIFKSTNGGTNWLIVDNIGITNIYSISMNSSSGIITANNGKIAYTSNSGLNWTMVDLNTNSDIVTSTNVADKFWAATTLGQIYFSSNSGLNWLLQNSGISTAIKSIYFYDSQNGYTIGTNGTVLHSANAGQNWNVLAMLSGNDYSSIKFINQNTGWAIGENGVIRKTTNGGLNWGYQISSVSSNLNSVCFVSNTLGFIASDSSIILRSSNSGGILTGTQSISSEIPSQFSLSQNYPNPFNPATKIKFAIPHGYTSQTILSVYDILGRRVAVLVNEQLLPGTYEVDWDASAFPSGVYFYTITSGSFKETRKMVLLK